MLNQQIISNKPQQKSNRRSLLAGERLDRRKMARGEEKEALALEGGEGSESTGSPAGMYVLSLFLSLWRALPLICGNEYYLWISIFEQKYIYFVHILDVLSPFYFSPYFSATYCYGLWQDGQCRRSINRYRKSCKHYKQQYHTLCP